MKNVLKLLVKSILIPLGLTAAAPATDAAIQKCFQIRYDYTDISNEEINDIIKIVKSFELSAFLLKYVSKTIKNKAKEQKEEFYQEGGNLLTGKGTIRASEDTIRAVKKYYQNEPNFNNVY